MRWTHVQENWNAFYEAIQEKWEDADEAMLDEIDGDQRAFIRYIAEITGLDATYTVPAGSQRSIPFTATDPNGADIVSIATGALPSWVTVNTTPGNPATGTLVVNPPADVTGTFGINLDAEDNSNDVVLTGAAYTQITVSAANNAARAGLAMMAVTMTGVMFVIFDLVVGRTGAIISSSATAAALVARYAAQLAEQRVELERRDARIDELTEVAARNDALYQQELAWRDAARYHAVDWLHDRVVAVPGLGALARAAVRSARWLRRRL